MHLVLPSRDAVIRASIRLRVGAGAEARPAHPEAARPLGRARTREVDMGTRWRVRSVAGVSVGLMALSCVVAPPTSAGAMPAPVVVRASAPTGVVAGVRPKYVKKYRAILNTLASPLWSGNKAWFEEQVRYGDQLALTLGTALGVPGESAQQLIQQLELRAAEWGIEMFATTDVEMPLSIPRIEAFRDACLGYVKTKDDRDFIKYEFGRLILAQETQLSLTVGGDVSKMSKALADGNIGAYRDAVSTAQQDWATADRTFTKALNELRQFGP